MLFGVLDPLQTCTGNVGTLIIGIEFFFFFFFFGGGAGSLL